MNVGGQRRPLGRKRKRREAPKRRKKKKKDDDNDSSGGEKPVSIQSVTPGNKVGGVEIKIEEGIPAKKEKRKSKSMSQYGYHQYRHHT